MIQVNVIEDIIQEPVTLEMVKEWMNIDYPDWDNMLNMLIVASRQHSEKISGQAYGPKLIEVTGNAKDEKVYPIQPFIEDVTWSEEDGVVKYRYRAGFSVLPDTLKIAILQRVATGFAYRQNGVQEAVNAAINQSAHLEIKYTYLFV